jgi:pimeloyl-ACP methyl ester carboxylesterase
VLALDQRGRGDTDWAPGGDYSGAAFVADLVGFSDALGLDTFTLIGHSMGGRNSLAFAGRHAARLQKLVIVDIGPTVDPRGGQRITRELQEVPEEFDSLEAVFEYMNRQNRFSSERVMRRRLQYATRELPGGKVGWKYDLAVRDQRRNGTSAPAEDLWPLVPNITCATLVVRGKETDLLTPEGAQQMVETLPNGSVVEVERAGHMVFEDNPEGFIAAVKGWLLQP